MRKVLWLSVLMVAAIGLVSGSVLLAKPAADKGNPGGESTGGVILTPESTGLETLIRCKVDCELDGVIDDETVQADENACLEHCESVCEVIKCRVVEQ